MRIFRKIVLVLLVLFVLIVFGGYLYFDQKFSPSENYLNVSGNTENIPVKWISDNNNPYSVMLLPVKIQGIDKEFYMQLDFGSPTTVFYKNTVQSLAAKFPEKFVFPKNADQIALNFELKDLKINSQILNFWIMGAHWILIMSMQKTASEQSERICWKKELSPWISSIICVPFLKPLQKMDLQVLNLKSVEFYFPHN